MIPIKSVSEIPTLDLHGSSVDAFTFEEAAKIEEISSKMFVIGEPALAVVGQLSMTMAGQPFIWALFDKRAQGNVFALMRAMAFVLHVEASRHALVLVRQVDERFARLFGFQNKVGEQMLNGHHYTMLGRN